MEIAIADAYYAGKIIYPQQFSDIDPVEKADEIFEIMLGEPFYDKLAAGGLQFGKITIEK
jgi:iron complex transport system substrate-binding protein